MNIDFKHLIIRELTIEDVNDLHGMLVHAQPEYIKFFTPFQIDRAVIYEILNTRKYDLYFGFFLDKRMIGFYMLRGFDAGYNIPSYGVFISEEFKSKGLGQLSLQHAFVQCKLNSINTLMLKVHPQNIIAKRLYEEFGFYQTGTDPKNDNIIYHKHFNKKSL